MATKVAFLDRDGTINADHGYVYRVEDWRLTDRAAEAIASLRAAGFAIAVVTNQSGIAAAYYTLDDLHRLHAHMQAELTRAGAAIDAVAFCPHGAADDCDCRKPRTGMLRQITQALGDEINFAASWTIGDKPADIEFGRALGTRTALLRSRYWREEELAAPPDLIADTLYDTVAKILDSRVAGGGPLAPSKALAKELKQ